MQGWRWYKLCSCIFWCTFGGSRAPFENGEEYFLMLTYLNSMKCKRCKSCCLSLIHQGLSPPEIIEGYEKACEKALEILPGMLCIQSDVTVNVALFIFVCFFSYHIMVSSSFDWKIFTHCKNEGKGCPNHNWASRRPIKVVLISGFFSMKQSEVLLLPQDGIPAHQKLPPSIFPGCPQFMLMGTNLYFELLSVAGKVMK